MCVWNKHFFLIGEILFMCCQSIPFGLQITHKAVCAPMEAICALYLVLFTVFSIFSELCSSIKNTVDVQNDFVYWALISG